MISNHTPIKVAMKRYKILIMIVTLLMVLTSCQESKRARIEREAKEFTEKNCPRAEFEDIIILDSLVCHNDDSNDYIMYYSVHGDSTMIAEVKEKQAVLYEPMLSAVRNSIDLRHIKAEGLNIVYIYYDAETGKKITEFKFTPKDYN